ncbi:MAG: M14 family metallocarboxypeptidase [Bacteroidota bacterium]|nr:M14 family metallocarboxypeptidase [Bacteroidota bacterium]
MKISTKIIWLGTIMPMIFLALFIQGSSPLKTPLEKSQFRKLTQHGPMMDYLKELSSGSKEISLEIIGKSVQGREIPALFITKNSKFGSKRAEKPVVMVFCQQHGNEPSGKEAALIVARDLVKKQSNILKNIDLILIPMVNPDGAELLQRRNANNMDLNRNHVLLSEPEVQALHKVYKKWMPDVTLDIHEYNSISRRWVETGMVKDADEMLGGATNLNIDPELIAFSRNVLMPQIGTLIKERGFSYSRYIVGGPPSEHTRVRHSTTNINDGRHSFGIYNNLSFIIEGKRFPDPSQNIEYRTKGQIAALLSFLETMSQNHREIIELVSEAQKELLLEGSEVEHLSYIQMDYFPDSLNPTFRFPVFDLYKWKHTEVDLERYEPLVKIKRSITKPVAYIFSSGEKELIDLIGRHEIEMCSLKEDSQLNVELYRIRHVTDGIDEEKANKEIDVYKWTESRLIEAGSILVLLDQNASKLIPLLLEPLSSYGVVAERSMLQYCFNQYLEEGREYPIVRLPGSISMDLVILLK